MDNFSKNQAGATFGLKRKVKKNSEFYTKCPTQHKSISINMIGLYL